MPRGFAPWANVFDCLRTVRPWGPQDRVSREDAHFLADAIVGKPDTDLQRLEIELVYRAREEAGIHAEETLREAILRQGGAVIHRSRLPDIAYHALLVDLPVATVRHIVERDPTGLAGIDPIYSIQAQSLPTSLEAEGAAAAPEIDEPSPEREPIVAILDAVPQSAHPLLQGRLIVDDPMDLDALASGTRLHGTSMASIVIHGDLNARGPSLPRRIHFRPVMFEPAGGRERFPDDRLVVDVFHEAILRMKVGVGGDGPTAPDIIVVNVSLGDAHRRFAGRPSPWARALDRLSAAYGLLFIVSAGNVPDAIDLESFSTTIAFESAAPEERSQAILQGVAARMAERRLLAPAEAVNVLTVGALHDDAVNPRSPELLGISVDPYANVRMTNVSSALGPGIGNATKPDLLLPGGRERLSVLPAGIFLRGTPQSGNRFAGLSAAAPPVGAGAASATMHVVGTSPAAALGTRTAHRIHDALEDAYPDFVELPGPARALILKALIAHPAQWPEDAAAFIGAQIGPNDPRQFVRRRDNVRRFLGIGCVDVEGAVACAAERATLWGVGQLGTEDGNVIEIPVPACLAGQARPHEIRATLAWFTPVMPGRQAYRAVRLFLLDPDEALLADLGLAAFKDQPDVNQIRRGTLIHRRWYGERAAALVQGDLIGLQVQREPDTVPQDGDVNYALAVTIEMPGENRIYEQVRTRVAVAPRVTT
jgi:Subtilase family